MVNRAPARRHLSNTLKAAALFGVLVYLGSQFWDEELGLPAKARIAAEIAALESELAVLRAEREFLERRVDALDSNNLDLDMLKEQAHRQLFYAAPNEVVIDRRPQ